MSDDEGKENKGFRLQETNISDILTRAKELYGSRVGEAKWIYNSKEEERL